jgi:Ferritin-like domain
VRRALLVLAAAAALTAGLASCGGGGGTTVTSGKDAASTVASETEADAEVLNEVLGRQMAAASAYERIVPGLRGRDRAVARKFGAQEQEHVDAIVAALRDLGAAAEPRPETIDASAPKTRAERLEFLYVLESATINFELSAISKLTAPSPRVLLGSIVANQAQHLVLLRHALGAKPLETVPSAFENGKAPAP